MTWEEATKAKKRCWEITMHIPAGSDGRRFGAHLMVLAIAETLSDAVEIAHSAVPGAKCWAAKHVGDRLVVSARATGDE